MTLHAVSEKFNALPAILHALNFKKFHIFLYLVLQFYPNQDGVKVKDAEYCVVYPQFF